MTAPEHIKQTRDLQRGKRHRHPRTLVISEGERSRDTHRPGSTRPRARSMTIISTPFNARRGWSGRPAGVPPSITGVILPDAENAAWIGEYQQMIYGDGGKIFKPLAYGLDVIGHEFTHGVTGSTADLEYQGQSGALNESYSEFLARSLTAATGPSGKKSSNHRPSRSLTCATWRTQMIAASHGPRNPLQWRRAARQCERICALAVSRRGDNGGVHINSGIPESRSPFSWQKIGPEKLEQIDYIAPSRSISRPMPNSLMRTGDDDVRPGFIWQQRPDSQAVRDGFAGGLNAGGGDRLSLHLHRRPTPIATTRPPRHLPTSNRRVART